MSDNKLTVNFELLGRQETTRILGWKIESGYLTSTDAFSFDILPDFTNPVYRDLELQPVELIVQGNSQLFGRIERTVIGDQGNVVSCSGRDYLSDIVECNADPAVIIKESMTLGEALVNALEPCGIVAVFGDDEVALENIRTGRTIRKGKRRKKKTDPLSDYKPRRGGEGLYEYANRLAARHGATIQPTGARNAIQLSAPDYKQEIVAHIQVSASSRGSSKNNVIRASAERDFSRFPTYTLATSQNASRANEKASAVTKTYDMLVAAASFSPELQRILSAAKVARGRQMPGKPRDNSSPLYRLLHVVDDHAHDDDELNFAALRAVAERFKDTLEYSVTLKGHTDQDGFVWSTNTMVHVTDEIRGIDEPLWVAEKTLQFSPTDGATTDLVLWRPDSFQVEPKED